MQILYSRPPSHGHGCDFILVRSGPFQKAGREGGGVWKNPGNRSRIGPKFGRYGKVNQKSGQFANLPFHSRMNRKGRSSSGSLSGTVGFLRVHTHKCISFTELVTLSQYIRETLFSCRCFLTFRNKLSKFNFSEPQNSFFLIYYRCFFEFLFLNLLPFGDGQ